MDEFDLNILIGLAAYGLGFAHAKVATSSVKKTIEDWLSEAIADSARFGVMFMNEVKDEDGEPMNKIEAQANVDGEKINILIERAAN